MEKPVDLEPGSRTPSLDNQSIIQWHIVECAWVCPFCNLFLFVFYLEVTVLCAVGLAVKNTGIGACG